MFIAHKTIFQYCDNAGVVHDKDLSFLIQFR